MSGEFNSKAFDEFILTLVLVVVARAAWHVQPQPLYKKCK